MLSNEESKFSDSDEENCLKYKENSDSGLENSDSNSESDSDYICPTEEKSVSQEGNGYGLLNRKRSTLEKYSDSKNIRWSSVEHSNLLLAHKKHCKRNNKWVLISKFVSTRDSKQCKAHYQKFRDKVFFEKGRDANSLRASRKYMSQTKRKLNNNGVIEAEEDQELEKIIPLCMKEGLEYLQKVITVQLKEIENQKTKSKTKNILWQKNGRK